MLNRTYRTLLASFCILTSACTAAYSLDDSSRASTVEEQRLPLALAAMPLPLAQVKQQANNNAQSVLLAADLNGAQVVGNQVWRHAVMQTQQGLVDDRPLYWQRLASNQRIRQQCKQPDCASQLAAFEYSSRGALDLQFPRADTLRILVTGFDPFALDRQVSQTNPSGVLALQLDNRLLTDRDTGQAAQIQSLIFPVRFSDFDEGLVERVLTPLLENNLVDVIITLSMGRSGFDLERFPGKRRATTAADNLNQQTGASATNPLLPLLNGKPIDGPEFVEFSLPVRALALVQTPYPVTDNRQISTLEDGQVDAASLSSLAGKTAVAGSGGTYLSNEISYRSIALSQRLNRLLPIGHIHLPRLAGYDEATLMRISNQLQTMLAQAIPALVHAAKR